MNGDANHAALVRYWWSRAEESLSSARREFAAEAYMFAVNRVYYAAFYAVCAALLERRQSFKKHSGVRAAFHREFVKTGSVGMEWGRFYDHLFEDRQEADYVAMVSFEADYVQGILARCKLFLDQVRPLIPSLLDSPQ
jgi:uncharacterized protein (UPF0332 family)